MYTTIKISIVSSERECESHGSGVFVCVCVWLYDAVK